MSAAAIQTLTRLRIGMEDGAAAMPSEKAFIRIILARLVKEGGRILFPVIGDIIFGILEDYGAEVDKEEVQKQIDELCQRADEHEALIFLLTQLKTGHLLGANADALGAGAAVESLIDCLIEPEKAKPDRRLEAVIEKQVLSKATLVGVELVPERNSLVVDVAGLESGKLFFPIQFMAEELPAHEDGARAMSELPLKALFDSSNLFGRQKYIIISFDADRFSLTANPQPVIPGSNRQSIRQLEKVDVVHSHPEARFEYWPGGTRDPQFLVDIKLADPVELRFRKKGKAPGMNLLLRLSFDGRAERSGG